MSSHADLPPVFAAYLDGLEEQRWSGTGPNPFQRCFGCGPGHSTGLHVRCFRAPDGVLAPIIVPRVYEGPPGAAHGGIVAAYLDEICSGAALAGTGRIAVTGELAVRYVRPVPIDSPLLGRGSLVEDHGRYVDVKAQIEDLDGGRLLATARGRFFHYRP